MNKLERKIMVIAFIAIGIGFISRAFNMNQIPIYFLAIGGFLLILSGVMHGIRSFRNSKK